MKSAAVKETSQSDPWYEVTMAILPRAGVLEWQAWFGGCVMVGFFGFGFGVMTGMLNYEISFTGDRIMAGIFALFAGPILWGAIGLHHGPRSWRALARKLSWLEVQLGAKVVADLAAQGEATVREAGEWELLERHCGEGVRLAMADAYKHSRLTALGTILGEATGLGKERLGFLLQALVGSDWSDTTIRTKALELLGPSGLRYSLSNA